MDGVFIQFFPECLVDELLSLYRPFALKGVGIDFNSDVASIRVIIRAYDLDVIGSQRRRDLLLANVDDGFALSGLGRHGPGQNAEPAGAASWDGGGECPCRGGKHGGKDKES